MAYSKADKAEMLNFLKQVSFKKFAAYKLFKENHPKFNRQTLDNWLQNDPEFKKEYEYEIQNQIEEAEQAHRYLRNGIGIEEDGQIIGWIEKPDRQAIENFLRKCETGSWVKKEINELTGDKIKFIVERGDTNTNQDK